MSGRHLVSSKELADQLGLSRRTITRYVERGWLTPAFETPTGKYRFDPEQARAQLRAVNERLKAERAERDATAGTVDSDGEDDQDPPPRR